MPQTRRIREETWTIVVKRELRRRPVGGVGLVTYFVSTTGDSRREWEYTENDVHDLQQRQCLRPFSILADTDVDILTARRRKCEDGAAEDTEPKKAGDGVVGD